MTSQGQLSLRVQATLDRLVWGFGDLKRLLLEHGAWPASASVVVAPDGECWSVLGGRLRKLRGSRKAVGLLVPESECLWGTVQLPTMPRKALSDAVDEALWRVSPLPPDQIVAAWKAEPNNNGGWSVQWGVCRRSERDQLLTKHRLGEGAPMFLVRQGCAVPVRNVAWRKQSGRQRWMDGGAWVLLLLLLVALSLSAVMPLVLKRQAVVRAVEHVNMLVPKAAPLRQKMDELRRQADIAEELRKSVGTDLPLASVVDVLSAALPADAWLDRIEINGSEIRITGLTSNAPELIGQLGRHASLADVRATGANVRDGQSNKERFTFEMRWRGEGAKP